MAVRQIQGGPKKRKFSKSLVTSVCENNGVPRIKMFSSLLGLRIFDMETCKMVRFLAHLVNHALTGQIISIFGATEKFVRG